jgi:excinuclease UvrABC nuclease subunit
LVKLLQSGSAPQLDALRHRMEKLAEQWRFEEAGEVKLQIEAIEAVAARLLRLSRMRRENNAVIARPAISAEGEARFALFLVQGGIVRRHLVVGGSEQDWLMAGREVRELFAQDLLPQEFTAQEELDEMMILDRWLRAHGDEPDVVWMNERRGRQWNGNAMRQLRRACGIGVSTDSVAIAA